MSTNDKNRKVITTKQLEENTKLMEQYLSENDEKNLQTNILNEIRFANKQDEYVFNMLPLTLKQKEELLLNLYKTNNNKDDIKLDPSQ